MHPDASIQSQKRPADSSSPSTPRLLFVNSNLEPWGKHVVKSRPALQPSPATSPDISRGAEQCGYWAADGAHCFRTGMTTTPQAAATQTTRWPCSYYCKYGHSLQKEDAQSGIPMRGMKASPGQPPTTHSGALAGKRCTNNGAEGPSAGSPYAQDCSQYCQKMHLLQRASAPSGIQMPGMKKTRLDTDPGTLPGTLSDTGQTQTAQLTHGKGRAMPRI